MILSQSCKFSAAHEQLLIADAYDVLMSGETTPLFQHFFNAVRYAMPPRRQRFLYDVDVRDRLDKGAVTVMIRGEELEPLSMEKSNLMGGFIGEQGDAETIASRLSIKNSSVIDDGRGRMLGITTGIASPRFHAQSIMKALAAAIRAITEFNDVAKIVSTVDIINFPTIAANLEISSAVDIQMDRFDKPELVFRGNRQKGVPTRSTGMICVDLRSADCYERLIDIFAHNYAGIALLERSRLVLAPRIS